MNCILRYPCGETSPNVFMLEQEVLEEYATKSLVISDCLVQLGWVIDTTLAGRSSRPSKALLVGIIGESELVMKKEKAAVMFVRLLEPIQVTYNRRNGVGHQ